MPLSPPNESSTPIPPTAPTRTCGLRFSRVDAFILLLAAAISSVLRWQDLVFWWLLPMVIAHFFFFCNVFRLARRRELIWAILFVVNIAFWLLQGNANWFNTLACQLPVSTGVIAWELKSRRYHGILARRLNPALDDYLAGRIP